MHPASELIDFITETNFESLPQASVEATKKLLIDTMGVAIAGSSSAGIEPVVTQSQEWGGNPESTIWVYGIKLPTYQSAFVNSMMAHALDFDDIHGKVAIHAGSSVIPTAVAICESMKALSGKDLVTAIVVGVEVASRLGLSILEPEKGWHLSAVCGTFAAAAVAGKLLGLDSRKMRHALGMAYSQTAGTLQSLIDGTLTKRMQPGFAARSGILSAYFAKKGLTGPSNFLEGPYGFIKLYFNDKWDPNAIRKDLGIKFEITNIASKPYPCCRLSHTAIDAILSLLKESPFTLNEVQTINVYGSDAMVKLCGKPYTISDNSEIDAQFSLQYHVILALQHRHIRIKDFSKEAVRDRHIVNQTRKVNIHVSPDIDNRWGTIVEVKKKNGDILSKRVDVPKGQPENPMEWQEYVEKFRDCSRYAVSPLNADHLTRFIKTVEFLENIENIETLTELIV